MSTELNIGRTEQEQIERGYPFIVRRNAQPIPTAAIDAQPAACALINLEWLAHIAGAIEALNQPDAWQGTDEEIYNAQQQLEQLAAAFSTICEMSQGATLQFRQTDCTLEVSEDGGATWTTIFNAGCAKTVITYNPDTGNIEADGEPVVGGDTIINNTIIIENNTDEIAAPSLDKRCNVASYLSEISLPTLTAQLILDGQNSVDQTAFWGAVLAITAAVFAIPTGGVSLAGVTVIPAFTVGLIAGGAAVGSAAAALVGYYASIDLAAMQAEQTAQFWQDVKCVIYCNLPSDANLTQEVAQDLAIAIRNELSTNYPLSAEALALQFEALTQESLGIMSIYGALYDGSNCDLCACGSWIEELAENNSDQPAYVSKYITFEGGAYYDAPTRRIIDGNATAGNDEIVFTIDLSKTPAIITHRYLFVQAFKVSPDSGSRICKTEEWHNDAWITTYSLGTNPSGGNTLGTGYIPMYQGQTTKIRVTAQGWGTDNQGRQTNFFSVFLQGTGVNVFDLEKKELGLR